MLLVDLRLQAIPLLQQVDTLRFHLVHERLAFTQLRVGLCALGSVFGRRRLRFSQGDLPELTFLDE